MSHWVQTLPGVFNCSGQCNTSFCNWYLWEQKRKGKINAFVITAGNPWFHECRLCSVNAMQIISTGSIKQSFHLLYVNTFEQERLSMNSCKWSSLCTWIVTVSSERMFDMAVESHDVWDIYHLTAVIHAIHQLERCFIIKEARDDF